MFSQWRCLAVTPSPKGLMVAARLLAALIAVLVLGLAASALAAPPERSTTLLDTLWTARELAGSDGDRSIGPVTAPDPSVPELEPGVVLPPRPAAVPKDWQGAIRRVDHPHASSSKGGKVRKVVALTFDLCERANNVAGYENRIVDLLRKRNARATFFAGGKWMRSHPEAAMQLMADPRFEIGNHAWTHGNLGLMTAAEIDTQLRLVEIQHANLRAALVRRAEAKGLAAQAAQVPQALTLMRLPYGRSSELALNELARAGYLVIQWDVEGEMDEEKHSPQQLAARVLKLVRPGSVILLHANAVPQKTFELLRLLLPGLAARGYETATVGELLRLGRPRTVRQGYFTTPGDNLQYDAIFPGKGTLKPDPSRPFTNLPVPPAP